jgi:ferric-dicitrate binding protein FerR (iron transport regulator)
MTKLALHGLRSRQDVQDLSAEDRKTYRRWARGSCAVYAIVLAALFAGFWLHDRTVMVAQSVSETGNSPRDGQHK